MLFQGQANKNGASRPVVGFPLLHPFTEIYLVGRGPS